MKIYNLQTGEYKEIQLNKEEETFIKKVNEDYTVCYNESRIEVYEPLNKPFPKNLRSKFEKLGYKNDIETTFGREYYYKHVNE
jgi:hypothetical protein